jgi:Rps23 Pro-64 3,4-dihydroxylase Tpa1-like proline 4-hydroxylase
MFTPAPTQKGDESSAEVMLANKIHECVLPCLQHFNNKFGLSIKSNSTLGYQILKYSIGEHYVSHLDNGERTRRYASAVAYLNDDYEGGELYFQDLNFTYEPVAGDVVIFPSGAPFRHEAKPVISGTKYSIANWW